MVARPPVSGAGRRAVVAAAAGIGLALAARALRRWARRLPLAGARVLITGGSRGLGLVLAREFARRGARVAICARDAEELQRAQVDLEARGATVVSSADAERAARRLARVSASRLSSR